MSILTSTSAAPGSLLKHMVMVFRAILKKFVKDTDFPCNKDTFNIMSHSTLNESKGNKKQQQTLIHIIMIFGHGKKGILFPNTCLSQEVRVKAYGQKNACMYTDKCISCLCIYVSTVSGVNSVPPLYISPGLDPLPPGHSCYIAALKVTINLLYIWSCTVCAER